MTRGVSHPFRFLATALCVLCLAGCISEKNIRSDIARHRTSRYDRWLSERKGEPTDRELLSGPLSLERSILVGLANSRQIQSIVLEKDKARAQILGAYSEALPQVDISADYTRHDRIEPSGGVTSGRRDNYGLSASVRQPLYRGGLIGAGIRAARIFSLLVDEQQRSVYQDVIFAIRKAYYDALLASELERSSADALSVARRRLEDVNKDRDVGRASDFDVLRAQVEVKNLVAENVRDQNRYRLAMTTLLNLMGASQESQVTLTYTMTYQPITPDIEYAVRTAFQQHPDILESELALRIQKEAVTAARAGYMPEVDATFSDGLFRPDPRNPARDRWGDQWSLGVGATLNLFEGFRTVAAVKREKAALKQEEVALRDAEESALLAIRQAILSLTDAARLVESQEANVEQAREALRLAELGFNQGTLKEIDFLDARRSLSRAQANYAQAVYSHEVARLFYEQALGTLTPPAALGAEGLDGQNKGL